MQRLTRLSASVAEAELPRGRLGMSAALLDGLVGDLLPENGFADIQRPQRSREVTGSTM
jgi:hypothetical protein